MYRRVPSIVNKFYDVNSLVDILIYQDGKYLSRETAYYDWIPEKVANDLAEVRSLKKNKIEIYLLSENQIKIMRKFTGLGFDILIESNGIVHVQAKQKTVLSFSAVKVYPWNSFRLITSLMTLIQPFSRIKDTLLLHNANKLFRLD